MSFKEKLIANGLYQKTPFAHQSYQELYEQYFDYLGNVVKDETSILDFMRFSGQVYKYHFEEAIYAYGQNPNSTFLAEYNQWKKVGRYPTAGSKAIKILAYEGGKVIKKNVFDVSQTGGKDYQFPDWNIESSLLDEILINMPDVKESNLHDKNTHEKLEKVCEKYYKQFEKSTDYGKLAVESSKYILLSKLGLQAEDNDTSFANELVNNVDFIFLMDQVIALNKKILSDIDRVKSDLQYKEGMDKHGTESRISREREVIREIREDGSELSSGEKSREVHADVHEWRNHDVRSQSGGRGVGTSREVDEGVARETSNAGDGGHIGESKTSQSAEAASGRNREGTSNLQSSVTEESSDKTEGSFSVLDERWTELGEAEEIKEIDDEWYVVDTKGNTIPDEVILHTLPDGRVFYRLKEDEEKEVKKEQSFTSVENVSEDEQLSFFDADSEVNAVENTGKEARYDYSFPENAEDFYGKSPKRKIRDNLAAIRKLKELEKENRLATPDEQGILARYVGWGGLSEVFDLRNNKYSEEAAQSKEILTEEEYQSARESVLTSYYTDPVVIQKMYKTLARMGFEGGKVLDPSMGTGNFYSAMPEQLKEKSNLYGVELDSLTGMMAKHLHQSANVQIKGFEETSFKDDSFDLVISNIPFDSMKIKDKSYEKDYQIHDYFIKKSLDLVRDGGIVAVVTSTGTMDKNNAAFREELAAQAELLGAVRLPNNTFKEIAGTDVTSDILFFQKLPEGFERERDSMPDWVNSSHDEKFPTITYNDYFINNPEQVLGDIGVKNFHGQTLTVLPRVGESFYDLLDDGLQNVNGEYKAQKKKTSHIVIEEVNTFEDVDLDHARRYTYAIKDNEIYYLDEDGASQKEFTGKAKERVVGMIHIRQALLDVIEYQQEQGYQDDLFQKKLETLNTTYDNFVMKNGCLNDSANARLFREDDMSPLLLSLENKTKDEKYVKADIFHKATIRHSKEIKEVDSAVEALNLSVGRYMKVDMDYIQSIYPKDKEEILKELERHIFINPEKYTSDSKDEEYYEVRDEYLTGNVKEKLKQAEFMATKYPDVFSKNVKELAQVIPKDLQPNDINYQIGATWIPEKYYNQFMDEIFETPNYSKEYYNLGLEHNEFTDAWFVRGKTGDQSLVVTKKFGTSRASAYRLFEDSMNLKNTEIKDPETYYENGDKKVKYVLNPQETMLAREKQEKIQEVFKTWLFKDYERSQDLLRIYNDRFNCIRPRKFDGSNLQFPGMNEQFELRPHQKDVVARIMHTGRALMAHEVGAGKTASMIASGMMMKEQGMIQKPLYVVPNHLTGEFGQELLRLYPSKNVLVTTKKDFEKKNRKKFIARIATGDYDAVIIGHSQFEKITLSKEYREKVMKEEIATVEEAIQNEKAASGESWSLKQIVRFEKMLKQRLNDLQNEEKKDDMLSFEQLGVDFMFTDEAHLYKNLYTYTKLQNVAGVNTSHSLRASDMHMKCQYLLEKNGGRGVCFATGTPISNSMSEMYTMQRYLQPDVLRKLGMGSFDRWASTFGQVTSSLEITPEGSGYQMKNRFAKFHNLPELMVNFNLVADIQTSDMLDLPVPAIKGGKAEIVVTEATEYQNQLMDDFVDRAEAIRASAVNPSVDNMLKLTHEAKLMAIDPRLIDETAPEDSGSKIRVCCGKVYDIWESSKEQKSTQMIFSDSGTPKPDKFNVYDEIKRQLIEKGIPSKEIAFIHDANTEKQREELFDKVRKGEVRVLLGSTGKLGTGTNVQNKLLAAHHIDCPWRPSDLTQRDGRIVRQGNENKEVQVYRYVTKSTFDSYLWQIQEQKLRYISQVMTGKSISRSCDDLDETVLTASEVKAVATGNPLLSEKMHLDIDVAKLRLMKSNHTSEQVQLKENVATHYPNQIEELNKRKERFEGDLQQVKDHENEDGFVIQLGGKTFTERKDAAKELGELAFQSSFEHDKKQIGEYKGFQLSITPALQGGYTLEAKGQEKHSVTIYAERGLGNIQKLENVLERIPQRMVTIDNELEGLQIRVKQAKEQIDVPFEREEELATLLKRQKEVNLAIELGTNPNKEEPSSEEFMQDQKVENDIAEDEVKLSNKKAVFMAQRMGMER